MYCYSYDNVKRIMQTENGRQLLEQAKALYNEKFKDKPILPLNYSYQKMFSLNGNRVLHETMYFLRRQRLQLLQILAIADDKYLEPLEEILAAICDEFTWTLPAHQQGDYTKIALFSAETGAYLAETAYIFGDKLSCDIRTRIHISIENKIVNNYEKQVFWWEGSFNNWAAVCACCVGLAYLYAFPERFDGVKDRLFNTFNNFLKGIDEEGYCSEGVSYWVYGFGFFTVFFDVYTQLTGERPNFLQSEKVLNLVNFLQRAQMQGNVFLPFADGGHKRTNFDWQILSAMKNLFGDTFDFGMQPKVQLFNRALGTRLFNVVDKFSCQERKKEEKNTYYYQNAQVFIHKNKNYAFVAKSGHNCEMHNHNDVGAFQIVKDEKRLICDIGAGEYTRQYFGSSEERYSIFVCSSLGHSVPIVGGKVQRFGEEYCGKVLRQSDDVFAVDIAGAYGDSVESLVVTYEMQENGVRVHYVAKGLTGDITFRFVSDFKPEILADGKTVCVENLLNVINVQGVKPKITAQGYKGHSHTSKVVETAEGSKVIISNDETAYTIDYTFTGEVVEAEFYFQI